MEKLKLVDEKRKFGQALGAVMRNESRLNPQESDLLIRHITAAHILFIATSAVDKGSLKENKGV